MGKYLDKDFFQFLGGFLFLLMLAGLMAFGVRLYEKQDIAGIAAPCDATRVC